MPALWSFKTQNANRAGSRKRKINV